jgi:hypothetical protein
MFSSSHLAELELDWCGATVNRHGDLEPGALLIDLLDNAKEGREGAIRDTDLLTYLELTYLEEIRRLWNVSGHGWSPPSFA